MTLNNDRLLDEAERRVWWKQCKRKYSMTCFLDYIPQRVDHSDDDDDVIEQEHIETKLAAKGITLGKNYETNDSTPNIAHRKPRFETFDPWWLDEGDKEGRGLAEQASRDQRREMIAKWTAEHGMEEGEDEDEDEEDEQEEE